jgi:oligoendopeptidase F
MDQVLKRKDALKESTWNAESLFESWDEWQTELESIADAIPALSDFAGKLGESPTHLADWFDAYFALIRRLRPVGIYIGMATSVDTNDTIAKANMGRAMSVFTKFSATTAFSEPEMLTIGNILLQWAEQEPRLNIYKHHFEDLLRQKSHLRSAEVEEVLGLLSEPFSGVSQTASELTNTDLKFDDATNNAGEPCPVGQTTVPPTGIQSSDREQRRTAWESFSDGYLSVQNTLASNYLTSVKQQVFNIRVRKYNSVLESRLFPSNTPVDVFHNLINTFKTNLPTWHRYWEIKRRVLGVDQLHPYDIWAPIVKTDPEVSYEQAIDWICEGMASLGDEYVQVLRKGCLEDRWVDYAPNEGKRQGAAALGAASGHSFAFTAYNDTLLAMSVLAHELGHVMHAYLAHQTQPDIYKGFPSSTVAETASNFNQALVRAYLVKQKADDPIFQMALIDEAMFNFHRYFFIMPTLARFEWEVCLRAEQGKPLTTDVLNGLTKDLFAEGYGNTLIDDPERTQVTWAQFAHLYAPFYTFQYAIGISAAHALAEGVLSGNDEPREKYLNFLKAGSSHHTMDLFKLGGVDVATPEPVEKTFAVLSDMVDRLEILAEQI